MTLIRIFKARKEAEWAMQILKEGGIPAFVSEDTFNDVPIQEFGVTARFRVLVNDDDYFKAAAFLADKLKKSRIQK
jgi:hypothetical protein